MNTKRRDTATARAGVGFVDTCKIIAKLIMMVYIIINLKII